PGGRAPGRPRKGPGRGPGAFRAPRAVGPRGVRRRREEEDSSRREVSHGRSRPGLRHRPGGGFSHYSPRSSERQADARAWGAGAWARGTARPAWKANTTSWARSWTPSLSIARLTWVLDVAGLMTSCSAMSGLLRPR